jgi:hypothetical protein
MKTFITIIAAAFAASTLLSTPVISGEKQKQFKHHRPVKPHRHHRRHHGGTWNYNYNYKYEYDNGNWYQDPYLWGSVAGVVGGLILDSGPEYAVPPAYAQPPVYMDEPIANGGCFEVIRRVLVDGVYIDRREMYCP